MPSPGASSEWGSRLPFVWSVVSASLRSTSRSVASLPPHSAAIAINASTNNVNLRTRWPNGPQRGGATADGGQRPHLVTPTGEERMDPGQLPYPTRGDAEAAFAEHVNRGKVATYEALGLDLVMGERDGVALPGRLRRHVVVNCHCNGGVFNLGHRNPRGDRRGARRRSTTSTSATTTWCPGWRAALAERLAATTGGRAARRGVRRGRRRGHRPGHQGGPGPHRPPGRRVGGRRLPRPHRPGAGRRRPRVPRPVRARTCPAFVQVPFDDLDGARTRPVDDDDRRR